MPRLAATVWPTVLLGLLSACASTRTYEGYVAREGFVAERARLMGPDVFPRFRVTGPGRPLRSAGLEDEELVAIVERRGKRLGLVVRQLAVHHVAQGELAGEPWAVSF